MSSVVTERPKFFEGQYLGADDLKLLVDYLRMQDARHTLGLHTWGIATGLELTELEAADGSIEVFVQPGYAFDGYGRPVVVLNPYKIPAQMLAKAATGLIPIWIRYEQQDFQGVRQGFAVCSCDDAFERVAESFAVEAGARSSLSDRQSGIILAGGLQQDARDALRVFDDDAPLICDGSVPHQTFPQDGERARWLIPIGYVNWQAGVPGTFQARNEDHLKQSRVFRRQVGAITESIFAANGVIRLRDRRTDFVSAETNDSQCAKNQLSVKDLSWCQNNVEIDDLVWIEGDLRLTGDAKLLGTRLEFRDDKGSGYFNNPDGTPGSTPLLLRRSENNDLNGQDLQIVLGKGNGKNRLTIGQGIAAGDSCHVTFPMQEQVAFQDNGKVGIGTFNPTSQLDMPLTIRGIGDNGELLGFEDDNGTRLWQINQGTNKNGLGFVETNSNTTRLYLAEGGNVGIGTTKPKAKLEIADVSATSGGSPLGSDLWLQLGDGGDEGKVWVEYGDQKAPLVVLSDKDNPPRIQFQQIGSGEETVPQFKSWIGHAKDNSGDLTIMCTNLGVGTTSPKEKLDVRGDIKLGSTGQLFALGCLDNLSVIVGQVSGNGNAVSGSGYSSSRTSEQSTGNYTITIDTPFINTPVVLVSPVNAIAADNVLTLRSLSAAGFQVTARDVAGSLAENPQDTEFTFIALGQAV